MDINPTHYILNYLDIQDIYVHHPPYIHLLHVCEVILHQGVKTVPGVRIFEAKVNCLFHSYITLVSNHWQKYTDIQGARKGYSSRLTGTGYLKSFWLLASSTAPTQGFRCTWGFHICPGVCTRIILCLRATDAGPEPFVNPSANLNCTWAWAGCKKMVRLIKASRQVCVQSRLKTEECVFLYPVRLSSSLWSGSLFIIF